MALPNHSSLQQFQGSKQSRCAVALACVIVPQRPFFQGRPGWCDPELESGFFRLRTIR